MRFRTKTFLKLVALAAVVYSIPDGLRCAYQYALDTTTYAPGYSEGRFQSIALGMSEADVIRRVGEPWETRPVGAICWIYAVIRSDGSLAYPSFEADSIGQIRTAAGESVLPGSARFVGRHLSDLKAHFGEPFRTEHHNRRRQLIYSRTDVSGDYRIRTIELDERGNVGRIISEYYYD